MKVWARDYYSWYIQTQSSEVLLHVCLHAVKLEEHLASLLYLTPPHKSLSAPSFYNYALVWGIVCVKFLHKLAQA